MVKIDNYTITEDINKNQLIVTLPQTFTTISSTALPIEERKEKLSTMELSIILSIIKEIYNGKYK